MATDITINLNDEREAELKQLTEEANRLILDPTQQLTPAQFVRQEVRARLDASAAQRADRERVRLRAVYNAASVEDKAVIDSLIAKYQGAV